MEVTYIISACILLGRHVATKKTRKCSLMLGGVCPSSKVIIEEGANRSYKTNNSKTQVPILKLFLQRKAHYLTVNLLFRSKFTAVSMSVGSGASSN